MGAFSDLKAQFDPVNRKRKGDQFEIVCKWFLENDSTQYKALLRRVWLWDDWPDNWGIDAGIDLVAEDTEGRLWAIQAKAYEGTVTRSEVNKFLAEAARFDFAYRMLIATTDKLSPVAQSTMEDLGVTFVGLTELEEFEDWPEKLTDLRPAEPPDPKEPWDYQRPAIKDVVEGFNSADRGQLIMACGTGKTLTAWFIKEELAAERTLVLVPSLSLLKQTMKEWRTANVNHPFEALPVCSDETVGYDKDAAISHVSYLGEPARTDPAEIAAFLRKRSGPRVVFSTYQSSPQVAKAFALRHVPEFDLVIADEAHRVAGAMSSDFATVLNPAAIRAKRRLFMTATPRYYTGRVIRQAKEDEDEIASMDDHSKFGEVFHRLGFGEAIERGLLTDYQVAIIDVDDATYRDWAERGKLMTLNGKKTDARSLAGQIGLAKAMRKYDLRRVITFHGRVNRARSFAGSVPEVIDWMPAGQRPKGSIWAAYASGAMSAGQRHNLLQQLKKLDDSQRGILANARCLAEGVDVPTLDGVAFIDPRRAEVDIVQAVGRAIRKSDTKSIGTIVIPIFIDTEEDPDVALDDSVFKPVWDVVKALRAHDEELGKQLDELRRELGRQNGRLKLPSKIRHDLSPSVSVEFAHAFDVRLVEQTTSSWEFWFGLLEQFIQQHGNSRVPSSCKIDGHKLGLWVVDQRSRHGKETLDADRASRLESLVGWTWDPYADQWDEGYSQLLRYVELHGHARIPALLKVDGFKLGQWVIVQRAGRASGSLDPDRERQLEDVPGWTWAPHADNWEKGYSLLCQYVQQHGDARVPGPYTFDGYRLGMWVSNQRATRTKGTLDTDRQRRLEELPGWSWDATRDQWERGFSALQHYVQLHGDAQVPVGYKIDGYNVGNWVTHQRAALAKGILDDDRKCRLEELPGWSWDPVRDQWERGFKALQHYVQLHGDAQVRRGFKIDGYNLGAWVTHQRAALAKGILDDDRKCRLEELPGWSWDPVRDQWERGFKALQHYVQLHGDARVPAGYQIDGYKLGAWVVHQRVGFDKGNLDADYRHRLQGLTGWTWDPQADMWEEGYSRLLEYVERHGDAAVPLAVTVSGYRLGSWVRTQRSRRSKGTLDTDRQHRLESLPGWIWDPYAQMWEEGFSRLLEYVQLHGDARVPGPCKVGGYALGAWVRNQRTAYTKGALDLERRQRLEKLPGWVWGASADKWDEGFRQLLDYVQKNGDARVPQSYKQGGYPLGSWVVTQRNNYEKGTLESDRRQRLEDLPGWTWDPHADTWEEAFNRLLQYVDQHGNALVPQPYTVDGYRLGAWVNKQRSRYAKGVLGAERQQRLEELPGWVWGARAAKWEQGFCLLQKYIEDHGDTHVPRAYTVDGFRLGGWVGVQKLFHAQGKLSADRVHRLEELPGWAWTSKG